LEDADSYYSSEENRIGYAKPARKPRPSKRTRSHEVIDEDDVDVVDMMEDDQEQAAGINPADETCAEHLQGVAPPSPNVEDEYPPPYQLEQEEEQAMEADQTAAAANNEAAGEQDDDEAEDFAGAADEGAGPAADQEAGDGRAGTSGQEAPRYKDGFMEADRVTLADARGAGNICTVHLRLVKLPPDLSDQFEEVQGITIPVEVPSLTGTLQMVKRIIARATEGLIWPCMQILRHPVTGAELPGYVDGSDVTLSSRGINDGDVLDLEIQHLTEEGQRQEPMLHRLPPVPYRSSGQRSQRQQAAAAAQPQPQQHFGASGAPASGSAAAAAAPAGAGSSGAASDGVGLGPGSWRSLVNNRNKNPWTVEETDALLEGMERYGKAYATITEQYPVLKRARTQVNMKDRWRNLVQSYTKGWVGMRHPITPAQQMRVRNLVYLYDRWAVPQDPAPDNQQADAIENVPSPVGEVV